jgi:hypothetical protein|tara:strand:+ start:512 stop:1048 length:537 start_codon:yes stop_codon:yes gene_type:complete
MNNFFEHTTEIKHCGNDILTCPFLTTMAVDSIRDSCEQIATWETNKRLEYFTHDIHFKVVLPTLYEILTEYLEEEIFPLAMEFWNIDEFKVSDLFAIKYSSDTQTSLGIHHDNSFVSGSVKLNDNYSGAKLHFPRQNWNNKTIPVGHLILWPGNITHQHCCTELEEGEKHSLTIWSKQ